MKKALVGNWLKQAPMLEPKKQFPLIKYFPIVKNLIEKTVFETDANQTKPILMFTPSLLPPCLICIFFSLPTNFLGLTFVVGGYSRLSLSTIVSFTITEYQDIVFLATVFYFHNIMYYFIAPISKSIFFKDVTFFRSDLPQPMHPHLTYVAHSLFSMKHFDLSELK